MPKARPVPIKIHRRVRDHLRDHFVPHAGNNHHPHILKHRVLFGYTVILVLLKVLVILGPIALPSSSLYSSAITPANIIDLTNQARQNLSLGPLKINERLVQAAQAKAADMLKASYFAHTSPAGRTPWDWIRDAGYKYAHAGENLAVHFHTAEDVQAGWMASPSHRANIVRSEYAEIGVGAATGSFEGVTATFVVQMFGAPVLAGSSSPTAPPVVALNAGSTLETPLPVASPTPAVPSKPEVVVSSAVVKPVQQGYEVRIAARRADSVDAVLGGESAPLKRQAPTSTDSSAVENSVDSSPVLWSGIVSLDKRSLHTAGEPLIITAQNKVAGTTAEKIALISPQTTTNRFYIFDEGIDRYTTLLGFLKVRNLDDGVRRVYIYFTVFMSAALLLTLFAWRLRLHHPSVAGHAIAVMGLAILLLII